MRERLLGTIGGACAFLGLTLAAIGLFGSLNYNVTRRTKEIGIRAAVGASRIQIYGLILKDVLSMIGGGLAIGMAGSLALMRVSHSLLFAVSTADPAVIGTAVAVFAGTAAVAIALPARRAASIDPIVALRHE
jgi:ABC-type antimicrobial peptide transport system permease subunit